MRHIGSFAILVVAAMLAGCAGSQAKANAPSDVFSAMDNELSHAIGTTSLTSETMLAPMQLPESRMSLSEEAKPATQTWGSSEQLDLGEIPDTRE